MAVWARPLLLGIDPGLANTGWAVVDGRQQVVASGTIRTKPGPPAPRLVLLVSGLRQVLATYRLQEAALEELFLGRNASSAIGVAQARGAVLAALGEAGVTVHEYKPSHVKSVITGYGLAGKTQMGRMLGLQLAGGAGDHHAADAVAIAMCHARTRRLARRAPGVLDRQAR
ncbi:MAG: crossover junction endodeoxyribonuclease RuvC [Candidatus Dormibacteraeota bacterium]|nr:crossover junction endodeoxyribonuclease RuvC [Candidatus Dormibacteraeota bacterium]